MEKAVADFSRAIELDPTFARAYMSRGIAYGEMGQEQNAINDLNQALELTFNPEIRTEIINYLTELGVTVNEDQ